MYTFFSTKCSFLGTICGAALQPHTRGSAHFILKEVLLASSAGSALKESQEPWELCCSFLSA